MTPEIRDEMDRLAGQLLRSLHNSSDDFDGREPVWMAREDLRAQVASA